MDVVHVINRSSRKAAIKAISEMHGNRDIIENAFSTASKLTCVAISSDRLFTSVDN
jgi:hypothetical protein